ncbi:hypothetical protein [Campylobacter sp. 19-13652]|uniref:hypothetical protein n=1 Tax=Campylobacter sp. 19-13652 TaxID=2840180 RepID=UPI001C78B53B|nr:hypothetical protein [Campylobacter sp. 19-13652]BCX79958.1 hypothetical protein LBC_14200 [Campylobacter sp. 19-13652]
MTELIKNIGLGIFVNGAYAWQFSDNSELGAWAVFEGIFLMTSAIYLQRGRQ